MRVCERQYTISNSRILFEFADYISIRQWHLINRFTDKQHIIEREKNKAYNTNISDNVRNKLKLNIAANIREHSTIVHIILCYKINNIIARSQTAPYKLQSFFTKHIKNLIR